MVHPNQHIPAFKARAAEAAAQAEAAAKPKRRVSAKPKGPRQALVDQLKAGEK